MSKDNAINIMNGSNLGHKKGVSEIFFVFFLLYIKDEWGYWFKLLQKNGDVTLNRANNYYKNNRERLRTQARDKYRNLSEEEKNKKRESGKNRYCNMSEEKEQRLKEYQKYSQKYYRDSKKSQYNK